MSYVINRKKIINKEKSIWSSIKLMYRERNMKQIYERATAHYIYYYVVQVSNVDVRIFDWLSHMNHLLRFVCHPFSYIQSFMEKLVEGKWSTSTQKCRHWAHIGRNISKFVYRMDVNSSSPLFCASVLLCFHNKTAFTSYT